MDRARWTAVAVAVAVAVQVGRFLVLLVAPVLVICGWFIGLFGAAACTVNAVVLVTRYRLHRGGRPCCGWRAQPGSRGPGRMVMPIRGRVAELGRPCPRSWRTPGSTPVTVLSGRPFGDAAIAAVSVGYLIVGVVLRRGSPTAEGRTGPARSLR